MVLFWYHLCGIPDDVCKCVCLMCTRVFDCFLTVNFAWYIVFCAWIWLTFAWLDCIWLLALSHTQPYIGLIGLIMYWNWLWLNFIYELNWCLCRKQLSNDCSCARTGLDLAWLDCIWLIALPHTRPYINLIGLIICKFKLTLTQFYLRIGLVFVFCVGLVNNWQTLVVVRKLDWVWHDSCVTLVWLTCVYIGSGYAFIIDVCITLFTGNVSQENMPSYRHVDDDMVSVRSARTTPARTISKAFLRLPHDVYGTFSLPCRATGGRKKTSQTQTQGSRQWETCEYEASQVYISL